MKLTDILKEIKITGPKTNEFITVFLDLVSKKYPDSSWKVKDKNEIQSVEIGGTDKAADLYAWSIKVPAADPADPKKPYYVGVNLQSAFTKDYKGVLGEAIKKHTDNLLRKHKDAIPALFIGGDNWDSDAWEYIADKYNLEYITDDNWEEYIQVAEDEDDDEQVAALLQILP